MTVVEYQIARPDGTVLWSALVPAGVSYERSPEDLSWEIRGPIITRYRIDSGGWTVTARYPDGFGSRAEVP